MSMLMLMDGPLGRGFAQSTPRPYMPSFCAWLDTMVWCRASVDDVVRKCVDVKAGDREGELGVGGCEGEKKGMKNLVAI
jgi:hypothetical protein